MMELLIAMALFTSVIASLLIYQKLSVRAIKSSEFRTIAVNRTINLLTRLQLLRSSTQRVSAFITWNEKNAQVLPKGVGEFFCTKQICQVTVRWFYHRDFQVYLQGPVL